MSQLIMKHTGIVHGNMSFSYGECTQTIIQNRLAVANQIGIKNLSNGFAPKFGFGDDILTIDWKEREKFQGMGIFNPADVSFDAVITNLYDFPILLPNADCYPVVLHCEAENVMALAHGCRESLFQYLILKTVNKMDQVFRCFAPHTTAYVFTGICERCYILEYVNGVPELLKDFVQKTEDGRFKVNLRGMIVRQLLLAGIKKIFFIHGKYYRDCTCHSKSNDQPLYFSNYRNFHSPPEQKIPGNNALFVEMV